MAMEQLTEEECAVILAKLEEIGKKIDEMNRKLLPPSSPSPSTSEPAASSSMVSTSSSTSTPPEDATLVIPPVTMELPPSAPTRCSTSGPNQDARVEARVPASASTSSASPTASPTSSPLRDAVLVALLATMELPPSTPTNSSTAGLNQPARVPVMVTMALDAPLADPISTPFVTKLPSQVMLTECSVSDSARCSIGNYDVATPSLMAISMLNLTNASPAAMIDPLNWLSSTGVEDAHEVFEVKPVLLFLPPAIWYTAGSFQSAAELRPMAWPPFCCSRLNEPPKHKFLPMQVLMGDSVIKMRPTPWPSFSNSFYQVEIQSKQQWLAVSDWDWPPWQLPMGIGKAKHHLFLLKSQGHIDEQIVQIRTWEWMPQQGNNQLDILVQGKDREFFCELSKQPWPPPSQVSVLSTTITSICPQ